MEKSILAENNAEVEVDTGEDVTPTIGWARVGRCGRAVVTLGVLACVVVTARWLPDTPAAIATGLSLLPLIAAATVDALDHRLPNELVGAAAIPVGVAAAIGLAAGSPDIAVGALVGALLLGVPLLVAHLASPNGMGFGDVKAGAVLGAAIGLVDAELVVLTLLLALAVAAGWAIARRRRTVPLGPSLVAAALVSLLAASFVWSMGASATW